VVVTEEHESKFRIAEICRLEQIEHCRFADLIEGEDWQFG
jgi:hypothetical protein